MAGSLNKVELIGNLGKDPEVRSFQNGNRVASFSLATSESWKDKTTGEKKERTEWHKVSIFNENLIDVIERYVSKGSKLYIEGKLETRKWTDNAGVDHYSTEVVIRNFGGQIILLPSANAGEGQQQSRGKPPAKKQDSGGFGQGSFGADPLNDDLDDSIPF